MKTMFILRIILWFETETSLENSNTDCCAWPVAVPWVSLESLEEAVMIMALEAAEAVIEAAEQETAAPPILIRDTLGEDDSLRLRPPPASRLGPEGTVSTPMGRLLAPARLGGWAAAIMAMMPMAGAGAMDWGWGNPLGLRPPIVMPMPTEKIENKALVWLHYPWIRAPGFEESLPGPKFEVCKKTFKET